MRASAFLFILLSWASFIPGCAGADPDTAPPGESATRPGLSLTLGADALAPGESLMALVRLGEPAPAGGTPIALWSSDEEWLEMPVTVTVAPDHSVARFALASRYSGPRKSVVIRASTEDDEAERQLFIPNAPEPVCNLHVCLQ
jgi:hypothetical protein